MNHFVYHNCDLTPILNVRMRRSCIMLNSISLLKSKDKPHHALFMFTFFSHSQLLKPLEFFTLLLILEECHQYFFTNLLCHHYFLVSFCVCFFGGGGICILVSSSCSPNFTSFFCPGFASLGSFPSFSNHLFQHFLSALTVALHHHKSFRLLSMQVLAFGKFVVSLFLVALSTTPGG